MTLIRVKIDDFVPPEKRRSLWLADLMRDLDAELEQIERGFIIEALRRSDGAQVQAAKLLTSPSAASGTGSRSSASGSAGR